MLKSVGQKDQSTTAFIIVLHVVYLKLAIELDGFSTVAWFSFIATSLLTLAFVQLASGFGMGSLIDEELIGVNYRSVFNRNQALTLIGTVMIIVALEYFAYSYRLFFTCCCKK